MTITPSFLGFHELTVTVKREPAESGGKIGPTATHLESVKMSNITPAQLSTATQVQIRRGTEGAAVKLWEAYTGHHAHTDDSAPVTQIPDIVEGDVIVDGSDLYRVTWVGKWEPTDQFLGFLHLILEESRD